MAGARIVLKGAGLDLFDLLASATACIQILAQAFFDVLSSAAAIVQVVWS